MKKLFSLLACLTVLLACKEAKNTISLSDEDKSVAIETLQLYQNVDSLELNVSIRENDIVLKEFQFG